MNHLHVCDYTEWVVQKSDTPVLILR